MPATSKATFRRLSEERIEDARLLLAARRYGAAYYLAGYAIECGLKVVVCDQFASRTLPEKLLVEKAYSHNLASLVEVAGLKVDHTARLRTDPSFAQNWSAVKDWSEQSRYTSRSRAEARDLITAIDDPASGVMQWVRAHW